MAEVLAPEYAATSDSNAGMIHMAGPPQACDPRYRTKNEDGHGLRLASADQRDREGAPISARLPLQRSD